MARVKVAANKCEQCGYVWVPRSDERAPFCPKCRSLRWDKPGKRGKKAPALATGTELAPISAFWTLKSFDELAAEQGVYPLEDWEKITGNWPDDADFEEFFEPVPQTFQNNLMRRYWSF